MQILVLRIQTSLRIYASDDKDDNVAVGYCHRASLYSGRTSAWTRWRDAEDDGAADLDVDAGVDSSDDLPFVRS